MRTRCAHVVVLALVYVTGCAAGAAPNMRVAGPAREIETAELRRVDASNVYDAISRLRPTFFATRGSTSFLNEPSNAIVVIVNRTILGGVDELRGIETAAVRSVRRLSATDVFRLTGRSAPSGGIELVLGP